MTKQEYADLTATFGYFVKELEDGRTMIEGETNGIDWIIEDDFGAFWVYESTSTGDYISIDAFGKLEQALECVRNIK